MTSALQWCVDDWIDLVEWDYPVGPTNRMRYPNWYGNPAPVLPWNLRTGLEPGKPSEWFADSYPVLGPFYPVSSPAYAWLDPFSATMYQGYWWP